MLPCLFIHLRLFYQAFMLFRLFIIINSNLQIPAHLTTHSAKS